MGTAGDPLDAPSLSVFKAFRLRDPGPGSPCGSLSGLEPSGDCEFLEPS